MIVYPSLESYVEHVIDLHSGSVLTSDGKMEVARRITIYVEAGSRVGNAVIASAGYVPRKDEHLCDVITAVFAEEIAAD